MFSSRRKKHSEAPSTSTPASASLPSSQVTHHLQFQVLTSVQSQLKSRSHLQSPQEEPKSQPVCPWFAHAPPSGQSPSPFPRDSYALSTSATAAGELFLFGGIPRSRIRSPSNDLYVFSTRDFSTTLLQTSGDVPNPRFGHRAVFTGTTILIWGGGAPNFSDENAQNQSYDVSPYLLNLGTSDLF